MSDPQTHNPVSKQGWDTRAWRLAAIFCILIAGLMIGGIAMTRASYEFVDLVGYMVVASAAMGLFVCPAILSVVARRVPLLWAYLPWLALMASMMVAWSYESSQMTVEIVPAGSVYATRTVVYSDAWPNAIFLLGPLISAGPICLYRLARRRAIARDVTRTAEIEEAMRTRQEGTWPPAPAQMAQESPAEKGE